MKKKYQNEQIDFFVKCRVNSRNLAPIVRRCAPLTWKPTTSRPRRCCRCRCRCRCCRGRRDTCSIQKRIRGRYPDDGRVVSSLLFRRKWKNPVALVSEKESEKKEKKMEDEKKKKEKKVRALARLYCTRAALVLHVESTLLDAEHSTRYRRYRCRPNLAPNFPRRFDPSSCARR